MISNFKAIIFDFDGVVGETMAANYQSWKSVFSSMGYDFKKDDYFLYEGLPAKEVVKKFVPIELPEIKITEMREAKEKYYLENFKPQIYQGVYESLLAIKNKNIKLAVVTGGSIKRISKMEAAQSVLETLDCLITSESVENGKPSPDPFLAAAKELKVEPQSCLVIENAPMGITAAKSAGMKCFAIETTLPKDRLKDADMIFSTHEELFSYLELNGENK